MDWIDWIGLNVHKFVYRLTLFIWLSGLIMLNLFIWLSELSGLNLFI